MKTKWTESAIQGLKAQEAKDLAVELLQELQAKERAPITPGQVQLKELQYGLRIKEAEAEDNRRREAHAQRIKELEFQIEQERRQHAESVEQADRVRQQHAQLVEQVQAAQESLSIQLERATREHNVHVESLEAEYAKRKDLLEAEQAKRKASLEEDGARLEQQKAELVEAIEGLTDLKEIAEDVSQLRQEIELQKASHHRELERLDVEFDAASFEKSKRINQLKRDQDVETIELETQHRKQVMQRNMEAATKTFAEAGWTAVMQSEWDSLQSQLEQKRSQDELAAADIRREAERELKRAYNITTAELFDVTELYYRDKALTQECAACREQIGKMDVELARMRLHIEREPERIAKAIEAAKVHIQNNIEQATRSR